MHCVLDFNNFVFRLVKQNTQSLTVSNCESEKPIVKTKSDETNKSSSSKGKSLRKIQSWTKDDTKWFFEAICEVINYFSLLLIYINCVLIVFFKSMEKIFLTFSHIWLKDVKRKAFLKT